MKIKIFPILTLFITGLLFYSCNEKEPEIEEQICKGDNYTLPVNRLLSKLRTTHPGNLPTIKNYDYTYNEHNLLTEKSEYTFDYDLNRNYTYCNNKLIELSNDKNTLLYNFEYDTSNRLVSFNTTNSYLYDYSVSYTESAITVTGIVNKEPNTTIIIETNNANLVTKITRDDTYSKFEYDANRNLIKATDFSNNDDVLNDYKITYDTNPNPFYGQLKFNYLERFIDLFGKSAFYGIDVFYRFDQYKYPYLKNNPVLLEDLNCAPCYKNLLERTYEYDAQNYPVKMEESYVGSPAVIYEFTYQ